MKIGIMGLGSLGATLARRIQNTVIAGDSTRPAARLILWTRSQAKTERYQGAAGTTVLTDPASVVQERPDWLFLTLPDDQLQSRIDLLAAEPADWSGMGVIHTSGWLSSDVLQPLKRLGADIASMHPIQTFTSDSHPDAFEGIHVSLEGDRALCEVLGRFVSESLGANPLQTDPQRKRLLHAAAVLASNAIVPALATSRDLLSLHGFPQGMDLLQPLVMSTIANTRRSGDHALSGPVRRGDLSTVTEHLTLLKSHPEWRRRYALLSLAMLETAPEGTMDAATHESMRVLLWQAAGSP